MIQWLKRAVKNNWLFLFMAVIVQLKSMFLLSMLRAPESASISIKTMYFGRTAIWAHVAMVTLLVSIIYLFKAKGRITAAIIIDLLVTLLFLADIWYYRVNGTFISIRHLLHPEIFNPLGKSLFNFKPIDLLFFVDFIVLFIVYWFTVVKKSWTVTQSLVSRLVSFAVVFIISGLVIGLSHYYIDVTRTMSKYNLFRISWAPFQTFSDVSPLGYHAYDLVYYTGENVELSDADVNEIETWYDNNKEDLPDNKYKGMLEGKNLVAIQVESLEKMVINQTVYGQEITPTLNKLLSESLYFDNIYEQNGSGTSSDSDLMVNNSVLPVRSGSASVTYPWTSYNSIHKILDNNGYETIATRAELPGNWNWSEMQKSFGAEQIWDISYYDVDEVIGLGISDESNLRQKAEMLKDVEEPFYLFMPTLSTHGPFKIPDDKKLLDLPEDLDKNIVGAYFQSLRYADEAIKMFLEKLDENGQLENTVFMIYGDHCGVNKFYTEQMEDTPLEGTWWKENNNQIPLIIYSPGLEPEVISKAGGQSDFMPTILYLLGVDRSEFDDTAMGRVLVNTDRDATILYSGEIKGNPKDEAEKQHLEDALTISDLIIRGNYFKGIAE